MVGNRARSPEEVSKLIEKRLALTLKETAQAIGRSEKAIYHMIKRGQIPAHKSSEMRWAFIPKEIEKWLKKGQATHAKI